MSQTINTITLKDYRTGKYYAMQIIDEKYREFALSKLQEKMDYEYFESLHAKERIAKKIIPLDFTCPFCIEKTEITSRKEKIITGFFIFISTRLIDIFKCKKCDKEFTEDKLDSKKEIIKRENNVITNFENWKDAKREGKNPPEFASLDKMDEILITSF